VTRDSDLEVDGDDVTNLRQALRSSLSTRHFGEAIRLEVVSSCPAELSDFLLQQFKLPAAALYKVNGPVNLVRLNQLIDQADAPALRFAPQVPAWPLRRLPPGQPLMQRLHEGDVLLHHPFESFEPVVALLREAVDDPEVVAIRQTIYRTGEQSVLMELLIEAARRGKEVLAVVELKARFDEEANINWADRLEAVGAQVVYGIVGLKTHAKLLLITRREDDGLRRYVHLSTGNYNPRTARLYTDLGLLSADAALAADVEAVFQQLASQARLRPSQRLVAAPFQLHKRLLAHVEQVAEAARRGAPARIVAKINALTDPALIEALLACSQAGARIDLIVRGACMLPPGLPGVSDRIRVRSVIGRFLEHTRIYAFGAGHGMPSPKAKIYISSADLMPRNLDRRVEALTPILNPTVHQQLLDQIMLANLLDNEQSWTILPDGGSRRIVPAPNEEPFNAHKYFMTNPSLSGRGKSLSNSSPRSLSRRGGRKA